VDENIQPTVKISDLGKHSPNLCFIFKIGLDQVYTSSTGYHIFRRFIGRSAVLKEIYKKICFGLGKAQGN
jgi:hypothetical protein